MDAALRLADLMMDYGLKPDVVTYNVLITGLCKEGNAQRALKLQDEMKQRGLWSNVSTL